MNLRLIKLLVGLIYKLENLFLGRLYQIRLIAHDLATLTPPPAPLSQAWERGKG
ncbi:hypothetical protein [Chroococcidiopsis sp. CCMEE 29]|uniref:hypothetical protein n=1 Tax=Chroococcidiopsis sp. CCMEE 29 TaxID=155894 RepID=UPI002020DAF3|nr:hypothetical protein [Chroococcidiopsis sp. CCMEE 29]